MIFQWTYEAVMDGRKRQTRRPIGKDDLSYRVPGSRAIQSIKAKGRTRYQVGQSYAVQTKRGGEEIGRIVITEIRYVEKAFHISEADAQAEGFTDAESFLDTYRKIHGARSETRPCWALTFEVQR